MKQLTLKAILSIAKELENAGMPMNEVVNMPIYIGDDDELNGIHTAWFVQVIDANNSEDADFVELINENYGNIKINGKAILIS